MSFSLCGTSLNNTGGIDCDVSRGVLDRIFVYNGTISAGNYADSDSFLTYLTAASKKSRSDSGKIFPFPSAQEITDKSEANKEGTLGLGFKTILREGLPSYEFKVFAGMVQLKALRKMNNKTVRIFEYDANKNFWGTQAGSTFKGFQAKLFITGGNLATGNNVEEGVVTITVSILDNSEYKDGAKYMSIEGNIADISGLMDIDLAYISNVSNAYKISAKVPTTQMGVFINLYDDFSDALAAAANWKATVMATGATLAITTVVKDVALSAWTVTFDSTAFAALPGAAKILLDLVAPETLDGNDIVGIEGNSVILTK
jgi:hypothetical protein